MARRVLIVVLLATAPAVAQENPLVGKAFPGLDPLTWVGGRPDVTGARGLTLFRWWTTSCPHCKASLPALSDLTKRHGNKLRLVAVFHPKSHRQLKDAELNDYLKELDVEATLARDPEWTVLKELMERGDLKRFTSVSFLVDGFGNIRWVHKGPRVHPDPEGRHGSAASDFQSLERMLAQLVAEDARDLRVMSFNIRYGTARDRGNEWELRRELVLQTIRRFDPDVLGTQETLPEQRAWISERLPGYRAIGRGRGPKGGGEQCTVFVRKSRLDLVENGTFWLSPTPDVPGSRGWDAALPRIATWLRVKDRVTGRTLRIVNTHFDHRGREARAQAAALLSARVAAFPDGDGVIVTGDFNADEDSAPYNALLPPDGPLVDTFRAARPDSPRAGTFHGFRGKAGTRRIDWVLATKDLSVRGAAVDRHSANGRWPSDHFPVTAVLSIR